MIPFSEKLSFLMHISNVSNKALAAELGVDPSMVSLMRTGKRKLPRNPLFAKKLAAFFARNCPAAFQRQALSETLAQCSISASMPVEVLASVLESWLQGKDDGITDVILSNVQVPPNRPAGISVPSNTVASTSDLLPVSPEHTCFYYGEAGRREIMRRITEQLLQLEKPQTMLIVVDDNLEWLLSNYPFMKWLQNSFLELANRGWNFVKIMPPMNFINRYTESLRFWLPLYATGTTRVFYYPRLRGNLFRHSIIVVPNVCAQFACTVGMANDNDIVMYSTDPSLIAAMGRQFDHYLSLCKPSLKVYREIADCVPILSGLIHLQGDIIQTPSSLSIISMPPELIERCVRETQVTIEQQLYASFIQNQAIVMKHLQNYAFIDMCPLATAADVRAGRVPMGLYVEDHPHQLYYTPEAYVLHLRSILLLMEQYENYTFIPLRDSESESFAQFINEGGLALLFRINAPLIMLEIQRPSMITAFRENLLRKAESLGYDKSARQRTRMELRALIQELEN